MIFLLYGRMTYGLPPLSTIYNNIIARASKRAIQRDRGKKNMFIHQFMLQRSPTQTKMAHTGAGQNTAHSRAIRKRTYTHRVEPTNIPYTIIKWMSLIEINLTSAEHRIILTRTRTHGLRGRRWAAAECTYVTYVSTQNAVRRILFITHKEKNMIIRFIQVGNAKNRQARCQTNQRRRKKTTTKSLCSPWSAYLRRRS